MIVGAACSLFFGIEELRFSDPTMRKKMLIVLFGQILAIASEFLCFFGVCGGVRVFVCLVSVRIFIWLMGRFRGESQFSNLGVVFGVKSQEGS